MDSAVGPAKFVIAFAAETKCSHMQTAALLVANEIWIVGMITPSAPVDECPLVYRQAGDDSSGRSNERSIRYRSVGVG
jgi:hypothetical protein